MESITLEWRRFEDLSAAELYALLRFRQSIFVVEQCSPYADLDGRDCGARHLVAVAGGEPVGYLRVVPAAEAIRIGRVAVAPSWRRRGLGRRLMEAALAFCRVYYSGQRLAVSAQLHLRDFYASLGFTPVSAPYDDCGVAHIDMVIETRD